MIFGDGVGASLVRGPYWQLDVCLCDVDVFLVWVDLKPDLQGGTGFNLLRSIFGPPCKGNVLQKGVRKLTRLKSKIVPPGGSSFGPVFFFAPTPQWLPPGRYTSSYLLCYRGGPHMRSLISIDFPAPEMEPESAHVVSAVSVPYSSYAAIAMQHYPGNIHQSVATPRYSALLRYSVECFTSITQCN